MKEKRFCDDCGYVNDKCKRCFSIRLHSYVAYNLDPGVVVENDQINKEYERWSQQNQIQFYSERDGKD